jgi:ElaB/YqjD/DUF883 family membrane-anchored ribosome-binding protein
MDQQKDQEALSDAVATVAGAASDFAAQTQELAQQKMKEVKPALRTVQASAGDAMNKVTDLARKASDVGVQAATQAGDAVQGAAREAGNQAYQQATRVQGYVSEFVTQQPLAALLVAGAIGYGLAYLMLRRAT